MNVEQRYFDRYMPEPNSGCWLWVGSVVRGGYGQVRVNGKLAYVHRVFYEDRFGKIPDGMQADHKCRVPSCVNPEHIEIVVPQENVRRSQLRSRILVRHAARTHCQNGHEMTPENTYLRTRRYRYKGKALHQTVARSYICRQCKACDRERQRRL